MHAKGGKNINILRTKETKGKIATTPIITQQVVNIFPT